MVYESIHAESMTIDKKIQQLQGKIKKMPPGSLICDKSGKNPKYYLYLNGKKKYLSKKKDAQLTALSIKKYYLEKLSMLKQNKKAYAAFLQNFDPSIAYAPSKMYASQEFNNILRKALNPISKEISDWYYSSYEHNPLYPEKLVNNTVAGHKVRSKSEALIVDYLCKYNIPYHYEELLLIGEASYYPDFKIMHPKTGKTFYWEHFGTMDKPDYANKAFEKLKVFNSNGIILSINLVATFETQAKPLDYKDVEDIIKKYFLPE